MEQSIAASATSQRLTTILLGTFGMLALTLAALGLYGVMALSVTQRTRELGIRMALGAQRRHVLTLVLGQGLLLVVAGLGCGLLAVLGLQRVLASLFYGVEGGSTLILGTACTILTMTALLACWIPARWAARVDPLTALREE